MSGRFEGKTAAVIGAGAVGEGIGNGRATAILLARGGAKVLCADRDLAAAEATVDMIRAENGVAEPLAIDATEDSSGAIVSERMLKLWERMDVCVHVVGMNIPGGVVETSPEDWDRVFSVNLRSAFLLSKAVVPVMVDQGGGSLVFVSSLAAVWSGSYSYVSYEASKAGLNRLTGSLARAHAADGIRANAIMPGMIDTPHVRAFIKDGQNTSDEARAATVPMKRQGSPWEIAEAATFLASDAASYITGVILPVDGGLSA